MMTAHILLVDDEIAFQRLCGEWLAAQGYTVTFAADHEQIRAHLAQHVFDLVILDLALPPDFSPQLTLELLPEFGDTPVIVLTGHADRSLALDAIQRGAWDFIGKPLDPELLQIVIQRALLKRALQQEVQTLQAALDQQQPQFGLIGNSPEMEQLRSLIERIAPSTVPVLIAGPSGTGKELVARAIHQQSQRHAQAFVPVHCGAIPSELIESELFGYRKGAFTGAMQDRDGLIQQADGGTLFLDEVGEMPLNMQVKLLRVLQEGEYYPVGAQTPCHTDIRLVSATHQHIESMLQDGSMREDFYFRIRGLQLATPALAERTQDIPILARHFSGNAGACLRDDAMQWLIQRTWQGNVRELANLLHTAAALSNPGTPNQITLADLRLAAGEGVTEEVPENETQTLDAALRALELRLVISALDATQNNHTHAAQRLGISRAGLLKKMTKLGLR